MESQAVFQAETHANFFLLNWAPDGFADRVEPVDLGRVVSSAVHEARRGFCRHLSFKPGGKRIEPKIQGDEGDNV